jgi:Holliday junction resolvase RusA-like endonuclease
MIRLTLPGVIPSLNQRERMHWAKRARSKQAMLWAIRSSYGKPFPKRDIGRQRKCRVAIHVYHKTRRMDIDNLHGAIKPIIDILRQNGFIYNDSWKWLDLGLTQGIDKDNPRVDIRIEEVTTP